MKNQLSEAETDFFASRGEKVADGLQPAEAVIEETASTQSQDGSTTEAPAGETKAPATAPENAPPKPPKPDARHVPLEALQAERQKRQAIESELQKLQSAIEQAQQAAQNPAPSFEDDPVAALAYQNNQLQGQLQQLQTWHQQQEATQAQTRAYHEFTQHVVRTEAAFQAEHPDYNEASQYAIQVYDRMLSASIPDPIQRQAQLQQIAAGELARVTQQGGNPAEFVYNFARQMGYAGPAQPQPVTGATSTQPTSSPPPSSGVPEAVRKIQKGLQHQATLSGGGVSAPSEMTPELLAAIRDPAQFNAAWKKAFIR